jgi:deoxyribodipyrimidine photolyase-related protein
VVHAAEQRYRDSAAEGDPLPLNSVEGFVRQVMGWRDKPYTAGGAYIDRMSDYCGGCRYDPRARLGEDACPFTAGYWAFLERNREQLAPNQRMRRALQDLDRLEGLEEVVEQERLRGTEVI